MLTLLKKPEPQEEVVSVIFDDSKSIKNVIDNTLIPTSILEKKTSGVQLSIGSNNSGILNLYQESSPLNVTTCHNVLFCGYRRDLKALPKCLFD